MQMTSSRVQGLVTDIRESRPLNTFSVSNWMRSAIPLRKNTRTFNCVASVSEPTPAL